MTDTPEKWKVKVMALYLVITLCVYFSVGNSLVMLLSGSEPTFEEIVFLVLVFKSVFAFEDESSKLDFQETLEKSNECLYNILWTLPNIFILHFCAYFITLPR